MSKRKPRRKAPQKTRQSIGWIWWGAGLLAVGWIAFDANRATLLSLAPQFAATTKGPETNWPETNRPETKGREKSATFAPPAVLPYVPTSRTRTDALKVEVPRSRAAKNVAAGPARVAALPRSPQPASPSPARPIPAAPRSTMPMLSVPEATTRPGAASTTRIVTTRRTPLHSSPSSQAPVWATLEAGRPLRITGRKGTWRQVEAGIFTGWINADPTQTQAPRGAVPTHAALAKPNSSHPVPPGAIPQANR